MLVVSPAELRWVERSGRLAADPLAGRGEGVSVRYVRIEPGPRTPHRHPHSVEVVHVLEGRGRHRQGTEERAVAAGDLVLVPRDVPHCTTADPGHPLALLCFFPHPDLEANTVEDRQ